MANSYTDANGVYKNKLGITDAAKLAIVEYESAAIGSEEILTGQVQLGPHEYGLEKLCAIHKHLFQDVYEWAGKPRSIPLAKRFGIGNLISVFADPQTIVSEWHELEKETRDFVQAKGLSFKQKQEVLAEIFIKANHIHAFPEGNGRAVQVFMRLLAREQRVELDYSKTNALDWNLACTISGTHGQLVEHERRVIRAPLNLEPMKKIIFEISSPIGG